MKRLRPAELLKNHPLAFCGQVMSLSVMPPDQALRIDIAHLRLLGICFQGDRRDAACHLNQEGKAQVSWLMNDDPQPAVPRSFLAAASPGDRASCLPTVFEDQMQPSPIGITRGFQGELWSKHSGSLLLETLSLLYQLIEVRLVIRIHISMA